MNLTFWISAALAAVLFFLSGLHVYWALGGSWGKAGTIPENRGKPLFHPSRTSTVVVALGLLAAAAVALVGGTIGPTHLPGMRVASIILGILFVARSIGERKYVGFFKRVRRTAFAFWDSWLFSPLALVIGLAFLFLSL